MYIKWFGQASAEENINLNGEIYGDKRFDTIEYQIGDFLDVDSVDFSDKEVNVIAKLEMHASVWNKKIKAVHITKDPDLIRKIKLYETQLKGSGWQFMIFDNLEDARKWVSSE